jgi:hypothetical protein
VDLARKLKLLGCVAALVVIFAPDLVEAMPADPAIMAKASPRKAGLGQHKRKANPSHHTPVPVAVARRGRPISISFPPPVSRRLSGRDGHPLP